MKHYTRPFADIAILSLADILTASDLSNLWVDEGEVADRVTW